ncbi:hypothetical protein BAUCODRAFT_572131 [Baudoinia panamericana UAMH 10762]|uniref:Uncharacterized protein n=1 Tax=Baudoinia panamericana (strain UAMH 10762) TaxID=717646 RepID=M2NKD7_BAUPA|nr:uncharacterized protein BAUCODRAFT_572131 [Baudoinia panamericana UAMH 10762]EMC99904.1 hypothetical protein BAUCODRAFT_572131 [Baudoinia panamericana UAMH 10762]
MSAPATPTFQRRRTRFATLSPLYATTCTPQQQRYSMATRLFILSTTLFLPLVCSASFYRAFCLKRQKDHHLRCTIQINDGSNSLFTGQTSIEGNGFPAKDTSALESFVPSVDISSTAVGGAGNIVSYTTSLNQLTIDRTMDAYRPALFGYAVRSTSLTVTLGYAAVSAANPTNSLLVVYIFGNAHITNQAQAGSNGWPAETLTFSYQQMTMEVMS